MDRTEFDKKKQSGELVTDAALQNAETEIVDDQYDEPEEAAEDEAKEIPADEAEATETDEDDESDKLTPQEKTAFQKRLERERAKMEEKLRAEIEAQNDAKYSKHREAIEALGGDPDKLLQIAREAKINNEAQALATQNGWDEEQTKWYIEQQKQQQELKELRVQMQINRLKDDPNYTGIGSMERDILAKIDKSNGALTAEEAFWALGGPKRIEQIKLEEQQRNIAKRAQQPRTVVKDAQSTSTGEKPLSPTVLMEAKQMGITPEEARKLMNAQPAQTIEEWREKRKAK